MAAELETKNKMRIEINRKPEDILTAVQHDTNSRYLDVFLYDNGTPIDLTGCEVRIFMHTPETGTEIWNDGRITDAAAGRCEFLFSTQALGEIGYLQAQISIWQDNTSILSTKIFTVYVTPSLLGDSSVEASNEYGTLVVLFQNLYQAMYLMTAMVENFGQAGGTAASIPVTTFWQMMEALYLVNKDALENASVTAVLSGSWMLDYKMFGACSYVRNDADIYAQLMMSAAAANDTEMNAEALDYVLAHPETCSLALWLGLFSDTREEAERGVYGGIFTPEDLASSEVAMAAVAESALIMTALFTSQAMAEVFAASETAMVAIVASSVAAESAAASAVAMAAIAASETAMTICVASETAMTAFAASETAMAAIAASETAMTICVASETAMTAAAANATATRAFAALDTAMTAVCGSDTALAALCQSTTLSNDFSYKLANSTTWYSAVSATLAASSRFTAASRSAYSSGGTFKAQDTNAANINIITRFGYTGSASYTAAIFWAGNAGWQMFSRTISANVTMTYGMSFRGIGFSASGDTSQYLYYTRYTLNA